MRLYVNVCNVIKSRSVNKDISVNYIYGNVANAINWITYSSSFSCIIKHKTFANHFIIISNFQIFYVISFCFCLFSENMKFNGEKLWDFHKNFCAWQIYLETFFIHTVSVLCFLFIIDCKNKERKKKMFIVYLSLLLPILHFKSYQTPHPTPPRITPQNQ